MIRNIIDNGISRARNSSLAGTCHRYKKYVCIFFITFSVVACDGSGSSPSPEQNPASSVPAEEIKKPNILLIMADDLGYNDLAINNDNTEIDTPNMDQIARDGVRFTRHYASAVCSSARAALLTGFYAERMGYLPNSRGISPEVVTLPDRLKQEGYTTWHIGKWHIGDTHRTAWPDHQGFDHWFGFLNQWRLPGDMVDGEVITTKPRYNDPWLEGDSEPGKNFPGHLEDILTDKAINVLSDLSSAQAPWFLNLWFYAPHEPIDPAREFAAKYPDTPAGKYQALVNQLDTNIGRVIAHLDSLGALENTIVIVVSDNGGTEKNVDSNTPYTGTKGTLKEGGLRTPLIIWWPAQRWPDDALHGTVFADTISIQDIYPTLLASIDVVPPENQDGSNFFQSIKQLEPAPQQSLFWEVGAKTSGVLSADGRWRLYEYYLWDTLVTRLYDFDEDFTGTQYKTPPPVAQLTQMRDNYGAWYRDVHTVKTDYVQDENGGGVLKGMSFQRTPGFLSYTFGIGIPDELDGQIAAQAGIWEMSRAGNTVTAQYGDLILWGEIESSNSCHSIVISGNFNRSLGGNDGPYMMTLSLFIDGALSHTGEIEATLATADPTIETIIGDPGNAGQSGAPLPPVIMNTTLTSSTPVTVESFSHELCNAAEKNVGQNTVSL
ncbi:MAG: arylsulfatase A-like enzyme [Halioglobus sp.]|jgi:arylsulfatase A-like enzyme